MDDPIEHLLLEMEDQRATAKNRETFLVSVIIHLVIVILFVTQPKFLTNLFPPIVPVAEPKRDVTMLYEPPDLRRMLAPKRAPLSDQNRKAQPGIETPPKQTLKQQPPAPPRQAPAPPAPQQSSPKPSPEKLARQLPPIGLPDFPEPPKEPPKQKPSLEQVPMAKEPPPNQAQLSVPQLAPPSRGTDEILRGIAKQHASGSGQGIGGGGGLPDYDPRDPNMNIPGPQIISDTMGVDFNPYLLRVLSLVRRNWYTVIPEIARLGKRGKVVLQFTIIKNGSVPELVLSATSGTESLDNAALASIRLSNPFPPLPAEFPGQNIKLRFLYLYNVPVEY